MTRFEAHTPRERLSLVVEAITAHRKRDSEGAVFETDAGRLTYVDRTITLELTDTERERLDILFESFPVFKIEQPATRKAPEGEVHVSAIADPKHAGDFVERVFRKVYEHDEEYELRVVQV
jgi:hypothetical protein